MATSSLHFLEQESSTYTDFLSMENIFPEFAEFDNVCNPCQVKPKDAQSLEDGSASPVLLHDISGTLLESTLPVESNVTESSSVVKAPSQKACDKCQRPFCKYMCPEVERDCGHGVCTSCFVYLLDFCEGRCTRCVFGIPSNTETISYSTENEAHNPIIPSINDFYFKVPAPPQNKRTKIAVPRQAKRKYTEIQTSQAQSSDFLQQNLAASRNNPRLDSSTTLVNSYHSSCWPHLPTTVPDGTIPRFDFDFRELDFVDDIPKTSVTNVPDITAHSIPPTAARSINSLAPTISRRSGKSVVVSYPTPIEFVVVKEEPLFPGCLKTALYRYSIFADSVTIDPTEKTSIAKALLYLKNDVKKILAPGRLRIDSVSTSSYKRKSAKKTIARKRAVKTRRVSKVETIVVPSIATENDGNQDDQVQPAGAGELTTKLGEGGITADPVSTSSSKRKPATKASPKIKKSPKEKKAPKEKKKTSQKEKKVQRRPVSVSEVDIKVSTSDTTNEDLPDDYVPSIKPVEESIILVPVSTSSSKRKSAKKTSPKEKKLQKRPASKVKTKVSNIVTENSGHQTSAESAQGNTTADFVEVEGIVYQPFTEQEWFLPASQLN